MSCSPQCRCLSCTIGLGRGTWRLNVGVRWSDFSSFDQHTTWQAGLRWQPAEELTLRANYSEVFRAPGLAELYEAPVR